MASTPEPPETGSAGIQQPGTAQIAATSQISPFEGLPINQSIEGLVAVRPRNMGGEVVAGLMAGISKQIAYDLQESRNELKETRQQLEIKRQQYEDARVEAAGLQAQLGAAEGARHLGNISIALGATILGVGIELYRDRFEKAAVIVGFAGLVIIILGWILPTYGGRK